MARRLRAAIGLACMLFAFLAVDAAAAPSGDEKDGALAGAVQGILTEKCAQCHGQDVMRPKGRFGYVTDLPRIASELELVVPGDPTHSKLYEVLVRPDPKKRMPLPAARAGPLTSDEVETVRRWILAGASVPGGEGHRHPGGDGHGTESDAPASFAGRLLRWLGKFHPPVVHFPIAFLLGALLTEALVLLRKNHFWESATTFCVRIGALSAVLAAGLGWLAGMYAGHGGATMDAHRWVGVGTAVASLLSALLHARIGRPGSRGRTWFRLGLLITATGAAVAGHLGAMLVFGPDHFAW